MSQKEREVSSRIQPIQVSLIDDEEPKVIKETKRSKSQQKNLVKKGSKQTQPIHVALLEEDESDTQDGFHGFQDLKSTSTSDYVKLKDIDKKYADSKVDLFGIVIDCSQPEGNRTKCKVLRMKLIDDSCSIIDSFEVLIFYQDRKPVVKEKWIVRLKNVKIESHNGTINGRIFSAGCAVFYPTEEHSMPEYVTERRKPYIFTDEHKQHVSRLRNFLIGKSWNTLALVTCYHPEISPNTVPNVRLGDITDEAVINLKCKVTNYRWFLDGQVAIISVRDGTICPHYSYFVPDSCSLWKHVIASKEIYKANTEVVEIIIKNITPPFILDNLKDGVYLKINLVQLRRNEINLGKGIMFIVDLKMCRIQRLASSEQMSLPDKENCSTDANSHTLEGAGPQIATESSGSTFGKFLDRIEGNNAEDKPKTLNKNCALENPVEKNEASVKTSTPEKKSIVKRKKRLLDSNLDFYLEDQAKITKCSILVTKIDLTEMTSSSSQSTPDSINATIPKRRKVDSESNSVKIKNDNKETRENEKNDGKLNSISMISGVKDNAGEEEQEEKENHSEFPNCAVQNEADGEQTTLNREAEQKTNVTENCPREIECAKIILPPDLKHLNLAPVVRITKLPQDNVIKIIVENQNLRETDSIEQNSSMIVEQPETLEDRITESDETAIRETEVQNDNGTKEKRVGKISIGKVDRRYGSDVSGSSSSSSGSRVSLNSKRSKRSAKKANSEKINSLDLQIALLSEACKERTMVRNGDYVKDTISEVTTPTRSKLPVHLEEDDELNVSDMNSCAMEECSILKDVQLDVDDDVTLNESSAVGNHLGTSIVSSPKRKYTVSNNECNMSKEKTVGNSEIIDVQDDDDDTDSPLIVSDLNLTTDGKTDDQSRSKTRKPNVSVDLKKSRSKSVRSKDVQEIPRLKCKRGERTETAIDSNCETASDGSDSTNFSPTPTSEKSRRMSLSSPCTPRSKRKLSLKSGAASRKNTPAASPNRKPVHQTSPLPLETPDSNRTRICNRLSFTEEAQVLSADSSSAKMAGNFSPKNSDKKQHRIVISPPRSPQPGLRPNLESEAERHKKTPTKASFKNPKHCGSPSPSETSTVYLKSNSTRICKRKSLTEEAEISLEETCVEEMEDQEESLINIENWLKQVTCNLDLEELENHNSPINITQINTLDDDEEADITLDKDKWKSSDETDAQVESQNLTEFVKADSKRSKIPYAETSRFVIRTQMSYQASIWDLRPSVSENPFDIVSGFCKDSCQRIYKYSTLKFDSDSKAICPVCKSEGKEVRVKLHFLFELLLILQTFHSLVALVYASHANTLLGCTEKEFLEDHVIRTRVIGRLSHYMGCDEATRIPIRFTPQFPVNLIVINTRTNDPAVSMKFCLVNTQLPDPSQEDNRTPPLFV